MGWLTCKREKVSHRFINTGFKKYNFQYKNAISIPVGNSFSKSLKNVIKVNIYFFYNVLNTFKFQFN